MPLIDIGGRKLFYVLHEGKGDKQAFALLFVHGLGSSHAFYETITPDLVSAGFTCLSFDTPGSGLSELSQHCSGIEAYADDALRLLDSLKINSSNVIGIGHSMGTLVVNQLASCTTLAGIVLIGGILPSEAVRQAFSKRIATVEEDGMEAMANTIPYVATGKNSTSSHRAFIRALLLSQNLEGYLSLCKAIANANRPELSDIKCRVLAIAGEDDQTAKLETAKEILQGCSNAKSTDLEVLSGVGHWHAIEAPEDVCALIARFAKT